MKVKIVDEAHQTNMGCPIEVWEKHACVFALRLEEAEIIARAARIVREVEAFREGVEAREE